MPLLKKKQFEKVSEPEFLRDDEEVFYCEMTDEIFRDYDEFCQRVILCNSMVWSCSLTGKSNLTYVEALESEENTRKMLKDFPAELKIPVLFMASKTKCTSFGEMAEDVFLFMKDRYFVGENVEATFGKNRWKESHILQVFAPSEEQIKKAQKNGTNVHDKIIPASLYKYEVEQFDSDDRDISGVMVVAYSQVKRRKGIFSRERIKLFLKQHVELNDMGVWCVKESILEEFGISRIKFDQIFAGPLPIFDWSKKLMKAVNGKKVKQETLAKFLSRTNINNNKNENTAKKKNNLLEEMRKKEVEYKQRKEQAKQQKAEEKLALKQKRREDNVKITLTMRDWYKPKEDLELNDQKPLPDLFPVDCKIPDQYMGDVLMIMEFAKSFSKVLQTNNFFPRGLTLDLMERALTENEVAGPLIDIIQMFLITLFNVQDEEATQYKTAVENSSGVNSEDLAENLTLTNATYLATQASLYTVKHQGLPLARLPMYSLTVSEILRLHLLSSGARIKENGARWRYQQRGGYISEDDPGLHFRVHEPEIIRSLATHNVVQLSIGDKLKILSCLINQLLTYADVRDVVEQRMEESRRCQLKLRATKAAERRRQHEYVTARVKARGVDTSEEKIEAELENLKRASEKMRLDYERNVEKLTKTSAEYQVFLGQDRAFRKYFKLDGVPGIFINFEEDHPGECLKEPVKQKKELVDADRSEIIAYVKKLHETSNINDKENNPRGSPKKVNGVRNSVVQNDAELECDKLLMCSANPTNCIVHSDSKKRHRWLYLHDHHQIDELIHSLNKRGVREEELIRSLQNDKELLTDLVQKTPVAELNPVVLNQSVEQKQKLRKSAKSRYDDANLGFPAETELPEILESTLVDYILEMEEKIHAGYLGSLKIKDRNAWRDCLAEKNYEKMDKTIIKPEKEKLITAKNEDSRSRSTTPDISNDDFLDPGKYLGHSFPIPENGEVHNGEHLEQPSRVQSAIASLAVALLQVAQGIEPKYLKKPLGHGDKKDGKKEVCDVLEKWEQALLAASSFSQIFLHYGTLDSCVMWSRSALLARCRVCRRQRDSENMLLCNSCNHGHHLYCLKPKLKAMPSGKWYCDKCVKQKELEENKNNSEPVKKKRRIFRDEDIDDEEDETENEEIVAEIEREEETEVQEEHEQESEESEEESQKYDFEVCDTCGFGGELLCCDRCPSLYHLECVDPPLRRVPRGEWICNSCKQKQEKKRKYVEDQRYIGPGSVQRPGAINNQRRCAARAQLKIHGFIKSLRRMSESEDSNEEEQPVRRSYRRDEVRDDLPLHNAALQELLADVMKHKDAWAFIRPVQKTEVPDYYDVIAKPMDFGTIKYKLNMGEYRNDAELMADAVLIFENCNTYNDSDAEVYKCGVRLLKHFQKKSKELGLKLPDEMDEDSSDTDSLETKRMRIK